MNHMASASAEACSDTGICITDRPKQWLHFVRPCVRGTCENAAAGRGSQGKEQHQSSWTWCSLINVIRSRTEKPCHPALLSASVAAPMGKAINASQLSLAHLGQKSPESLDATVSTPTPTPCLWSDATHAQHRTRQRHHKVPFASVRRAQEQWGCGDQTPSARTLAWLRAREDESLSIIWGKKVDITSPHKNVRAGASRVVHTASVHAVRAGASHGHITRASCKRRECARYGEAYAPDQT